MKKLKSSFAFRTDLWSFSGSNDEKEYKFCHKEYDTEGRLVRVTYFSPEGDERLVESWKYNNNGLVLEELSVQPDEGTDEKVEFEYDEKGNCIRRTEYFSGEVFNNIITEFNEANRKVRNAHIDEENNELESESFEYNSDGLAIKHSHYDENGKNDWFVEMKYNENGKVVEEMKHDLFEKKVEKITYTYDPSGKNTSVETRNAKGQLLYAEKIEYDEAGNAINTDIQANDAYSQHTTRSVEYDEQNRPVETITYDQINNYLVNKEITSYDEYGEILEQEVYELKGSQGMTKTHIRLRFENEYQ